MQIVRKDIDALNITVDITLEPVDYKAKYELELKKYKNSVQIKGFRKGMVPMPTLKKMYGKAILSDVINESLQKGLFDYLDNEDINYLGQPLPKKDDDILNDLDVDGNKTYQFGFELGLAPKLDIKGVKDTDTYTLYDIKIAESKLDEEIAAARRRFGKKTDTDDIIQNMDMIKIDAEEVGGTWKTEFSILVDVIKDQAVKADLMTKKLGDTFAFDVYKLEDKDENYANKYLLNKPEDSDAVIGADFVGTISEVSRIEPAEMNEEFFATFGDESIIDEDSLRDFFRKDLGAYYNDQAKQYLYREIMDFMMANNEIPLPEEFLKRYLVEANENVAPEDIFKEFDAFKTNMKWSLQKSHLAKEYAISVSEEDLRKHFQNTVFNYMRGYGNMDYSFISGTVDRLMKDKDQVNKAYEEILANRVFDRIGETVKTNRVSILQEDFVEKVKSLNERVNNL